MPRWICASVTLSSETPLGTNPQLQWHLSTMFSFAILLALFAAFKPRKSASHKRTSHGLGSLKIGRGFRRRR